MAEHKPIAPELARSVSRSFDREDPPPRACTACGKVTCKSGSVGAHIACLEREIARLRALARKEAP